MRCHAPFARTWQPSRRLNASASAVDKSTISANDFCRKQVHGPRRAINWSARAGRQLACAEILQWLIYTCLCILIRSIDRMLIIKIGLVINNFWRGSSTRFIFGGRMGRGNYFWVNTESDQQVSKCTHGLELWNIWSYTGSSTEAYIKTSNRPMNFSGKFIFGERMGPGKAFSVNTRLDRKVLKCVRG